MNTITAAPETMNVWDRVIKDIWITRQNNMLVQLNLEPSASLKTRFKDLPHIVKINKSWQEWLHQHTDAELWCDEHCSDAYTSHWLEGYHTKDDFVVDLTNKKVKDCGKFEQAFFFGFKNEADATMFTLRWLGNG